MQYFGPYHQHVDALDSYDNNDFVISEHIVKKSESPTPSYNTHFDISNHTGITVTVEVMSDSGEEFMSELGSDAGSVCSQDYNRSGQMQYIIINPQGTKNNVKVTGGSYGTGVLECTIHNSTVNLTPGNSITIATVKCASTGTSSFGFGLTHS